MSYAAVILARNIYASRVKFIPGPYTLGIWQKPLNGIACTWVFFISVVLLFPTVRPVTGENMNYAVVVGAAIAVFSLGWWWAGARKYVNLPFSLKVFNFRKRGLKWTLKWSWHDFEIGRTADRKQKISYNLLRQRKETTSLTMDPIMGVSMATRPMFWFGVKIVI